MKKGSKKKSSASGSDDAALDVADAEAAVDAQQRSMASGSGTGYVGTMSADDLAAEADRLEQIVNSSDEGESMNVAPAFLARHPDANAADEEGDEGEEGAALGQSASRVGSLSVEHPRARMARSLYDNLHGRKPSAQSAEELSDLAERVGLNVDGSGSNGAIKSDFVREMDSLLAQHVAHAPASE